MTCDERLTALAQHGWRADCVTEGKPATMKIAERHCCWIQGRFIGSDTTETAWLDVVDGSVMLHQRADADYTWDEWMVRLAALPAAVPEPAKAQRGLFDEE